MACIIIHTKNTCHGYSIAAAGFSLHSISLLYGEVAGY